MAENNLPRPENNLPWSIEDELSTEEDVQDTSVEEPSLPVRGQETPAQGEDDPRRPTFMSVQRQPHLKFTDQLAEAYLEKLRNHGGKVASAQECGVSYATINRWEREEPEFARMVKDALVQFTEEKLERAALHRAVIGVKEPIIGGQFKDEIITYVHRPSDNLLTHMLKVYHPERHNPPKDVNVKGTMVNGNIDLSGASTEQLRTIHAAIMALSDETGDKDG